jgi:hypothetical protein
MITANYARFTEEANALDYLEKTVSFIKSADNNPLDWKWIILAIHGALYSFMICALKGTSPDNVCFNTKAGKTKLIGFPEALKRCQDSAWMNVSGFTKVLQLSEKQRRAVKRIHDEFRNQFVHYQPTIWSIELAGMSEIVMQALDVVRFVSREMGCYYVHYEAGDTQKMADLINEGQRVLQQYSRS